MSVDNGFVPAESVTVRDQIAVLSRRWRVIALLTVLGLLAAVVYASQRGTTYTSHAEIMVNAPTSNAFAPKTTATSTVLMPTEQKIAASLATATAAATLLHDGRTPAQLKAELVVTVPATTQLLDVAVTASSPQRAQSGAAAVTRAYLANRRAGNVAMIDTLRTSFTKQNASLTSQRAKLQTKLASPSSLGNRTSLASQIQTLSQEIGSNSSQISALDTVDPTSAVVTQQATEPPSTGGGHTLTLLLIGLVGGAVVGTVLGFLIDATDDHLRGPGDLAALTRAPVLARVPVVRRFPGQPRIELAADGNRHPKVAESYRILASRLLVMGATDQMRSLLVASPAAAEGRSSVAANLAAALVDLGYRVWLVSGDVMPPQVHQLLGPDAEPGLIDVLPAGAEDPAHELGRSGEGSGHLTLMDGPRGQASGRLLNPVALARQVDANKHLADLTIIDAPPLLDFADAVPMLPAADAVVVVGDAATTRRAELEELNELLVGTGARVVGSVFNRDGSRVVSRRARRARLRVAAGGRRTAPGRPGTGARFVVPQPQPPRDPAPATTATAAPAPAAAAAPSPTPWNAQPATSSAGLGWPGSGSD